MLHKLNNQQQQALILAKIIKKYNNMIKTNYIKFTCP